MPDDDLGFYLQLAMSEDAVLVVSSESALLDRLRDANHHGRVDGVAAMRTRVYDSEFGLVIVTGQPVRSEAECSDMLVAARQAIRPDGRLAFDVPNPLVQPSMRASLHAETLDHLLTGADFTIHERYGDWDRSPFTPDSREIITIAGAAES